MVIRMKIYYYNSDFGTESYFLLGSIKYQLKLHSTIEGVTVFKFENSELNLPSAAKEIKTQEILKFLLKKIFNSKTAFIIR